MNEHRKEEGAPVSPALEEWWDDCHKTAGSFYVSDYGGPALWASLNIAERVAPGKAVLEIGVGDGNDIRELHAKGLKVHALDITPAALQKVENVVEKGWLESQIQLLPRNHFDLAISHLVTQHNNNETLSRQIRFVLRSLRRDGIFAMQFADRVPEMTPESYREGIDDQRIGGVWRSVGMMEEIARAAGGRITWVSEPQDFPEYGNRWFNIHLRKTTLSRLLSCLR